MGPKNSIIVPIYEVEPYLRKCIDSILNQTFEEFELLLIDDGSPDRCGDICDEYAKKDNRIKVIHKENGGQASARNIGLDVARGEYIGFVDSDDWIEPDMYKILYNLAINNDAEISCISSKIIYPNKEILRETSTLKKFIKKDAMKEVIRGKFFDEVVWTKLFKKEILQNLKFKEGIKYEDTEFCYRAIDKCTKLIYLGKCLYNYLIRKGSTMDIAKREISIDYIYIYNEMYIFYKKEYSEYKDMVLLRLVDCSLEILNKIIEQNLISETKFLETKNLLNKYFFEILKLKKLNKNIKILLILLKINSLLYIKIVKILRCKNFKK